MEKKKKIQEMIKAKYATPRPDERIVKDRDGKVSTQAPAAQLLSLPQVARGCPDRSFTSWTCCRIVMP